MELPGTSPAWRKKVGKPIVATMALLLLLASPAQLSIGTDAATTSSDSDLIAEFALALAEDNLLTELSNGSFLPNSAVTITESSFLVGISAAADCGKEVDEVFRAAAAVIDAQFRLEMAKVKLSACIQRTSISAPPAPIEGVLAVPANSIENSDNTSALMLESSLLIQ